jgi:hypothetical protein
MAGSPIYNWLMHEGWELIRSTQKRTLFTNNSQVYYKSHSLPAGGIGTVKNYRHKAIKT